MYGPQKLINRLIKDNHFLHPNNIYESLRPLYLVTKLLGLSSFTLSKKRKGLIQHYTPSKYGIAYSLTILTCFVAYYMFAVEERNRISHVDRSSITTAIDAFQLYAGVAVMTVTLILNLSKQKYYIAAIRRLNLVDNQLQNYYRNMSINHRADGKFIAVYTVTILLAFCAMEYMNCSMFLRQAGTLSTFCWFMCYVPLVINAFAESQFVTATILVRNRFRFVNDRLAKIITTTDKSTLLYTVMAAAAAAATPTDEKLARQIVFLRKVHEELCRVARMVNRAYAVQIVLNVALEFISFTTHAYFCFNSLTKVYIYEMEPDVYEVATSAVWTLSKLVQVFCVSVACTLTVNESKRTARIIFKIKNSSFDGRVVSQNIKLFGSQLFHWDLKFTGSHLFPVNMTLFYNVISSAATYLIILIQLEIANIPKIKE